MVNAARTNHGIALWRDRGALVARRLSGFIG
jgi:hypothetical protein